MVAERYDLLLLDFGGVCLLNPVELHPRVESVLGLAPGTFTWMGPVDPSTDDLWRELTSGVELREREYWARRATEVGLAAGREMSLQEYMLLAYSPPGDHLIRPECRDVVDRALAAGISVSVLTNDLRTFHGEEWVAAISLLEQVDHIVDASETGVLKPDPRAYQRALEVTGASADRTLFVDDQQLSVDGAEEVGIDALWFDIAAPARSWGQVAGRLGV